MVESIINPLNVNVMGLNSGTSIDGIDVVLCEFSQQHPDAPLRMKVLYYDEMEMPQKLKLNVLSLIKENKTSPEELSQVNVLLGKAFAKAASDFCTKYAILKESIDIIGSHGQTIWYISDPKPGQCKSVLTLAEASYISEEMGSTVVSDFRISEQSVGRQGAPMIAFFDSLLLIHPTKLRACQNIGGISNVCFIVPESKGGLEKCFDYDIGPGNVFIDAAVRYFTNDTMQYDKDGSWGRIGKVDLEMVEEYLNEPYFHKELPKTTGRELFGDAVANELIQKGLKKGLNKYDIVATLTRITAQSIVKDYVRYSPGFIDEIYLCGGGAYNPNITEYIGAHFPNTKMCLLDEAGVQTGSKESITFAFQGLDAILGRPLIVPDRVETKAPVIVGKISPGLNYRHLQRKAADFGKDYDTLGYLPPVKSLIID